MSGTNSGHAREITLAPGIARPIVAANAPLPTVPSVPITPTRPRGLTATAACTEGSITPITGIESRCARVVSAYEDEVAHATSRHLMFCRTRNDAISRLKQITVALDLLP